MTVIGRRCNMMCPCLAALGLIVAVLAMPAAGQQVTENGVQAGNRPVQPAADSPSGTYHEVKASHPTPQYVTELPNARLAADASGEAQNEETFIHGLPAKEGERSIDAPVEIDDTTPTEHKELSLEVTFDWSTEKAGHSKDVDTDDTVLYNIYEITYGLLPNLEVAIEVPIDIGDGRVAGNGDLDLEAKYRFWKDKDWYPAFALATAVRLPTGVDSSGVDAEFNFILTKNFGLHRVHLNGILKTANGHNIEDLRHFQWAVGVGYDHPIVDEKTLFVADYFCKSSEEDGVGNINTLEVGIQREIVEHSVIGASIRVGLDDHEETPDIGVAVKYVYSIK